MRVCPKCGYTDPYYWRSGRYRYVSDICHIDDIEFNDPKFAEKLKKHARAPNYYKKGRYYYRLTKGNKVERTDEMDFKFIQFGYEKPIHPNPNHSLDEYISK